MDKNTIANSVAYCGLVCEFCNVNSDCSCKGENNCGKRLSPDGCYQYNCCTQKGLNGCWECEDAPCGRDMLAQGKVKIRAFVRCVKEDGLDKFAGYLVKNQREGLLYHRNGVFGDYDLDNESDVLELLRKGK